MKGKLELAGLRKGEVETEASASGFASVVSFYFFIYFFKAMVNLAGRMNRDFLSCLGKVESAHLKTRSR